MITAMLTLPIAGAAQYIVDQYPHPGALATALVPIPLVDLLPVKGRMRGVKAFAWCSVYFLPAAIFHIQMALFGTVLWIFLLIPWERWLPAMGRVSLALAPIPIIGKQLEPGSPPWQEAARTRSQHYLVRWQWYK